MTTEDIIFYIFCYVDDRMKDAVKHRDGLLYPSEIVTIGILYALKGGRFRAFYRWLKRDYEYLFKQLPERTRLQRVLKEYQDRCDHLLVVPSFFTVADSFPIELIFPIRAGRSNQQIGKKNKDKGRWSIGIKLCWVLNEVGQVVSWTWATMNRPDQDFNLLIETLDGQTITLADLGFRCADGMPGNLKLCRKGTWNERMMVETSFSMITVVCGAKKLFHRVASYIEAHLAYLVAMFNVLLGLFHLLHPDAPAHKMSIAEFSL
jgi:hypothetical protein